MKVAFIERGPHLIHKRFAESLNAYTIHFEPHPFNVLSFVKALTQIFKLRPHVILCEDSSGLLLAYIWKKLGNAKSILWGADSIYYGLGPVKRAIVWWLTRNIDGFLAPSKYIEKIARNLLKCQVKLVKYFVDPSFARVEADLTSKNICFLGTYSPRKGIERLVRAFDKIRLKYPESKLYLIGNIPKKFAGPGIILTGRVPNPAEYMKKCSVYVHPAVYEPFGVTVIEAILAGLIPVVTKNTGASQYVDDWLIIDGSEDSIVAKVLEIFQLPPSKLREISRTLRKRIMSEGLCDMESRLKEFRSTFFSLLKPVDSEVAGQR